MKKIYGGVLAVSCGLLALLFAACSGSDDEESQPGREGVKVRKLTIIQTGGGSDGAREMLDTRATLTPSGTDGKVLAASWTAGDNLSFCNLREIILSTGSLTATTSAPTSSFTGSVSCGNGDYIAVVYPVSVFSGSDSSYRYTISLAGQDGTLPTLASNFHYVYGVATVESVTEATAQATMAEMKSLLTVCKFSFVDKENDNSIPVSTLTISFGNDGDGGNAGTYPQTAKVTCSDTPASVYAQAVSSGSQLTVTLPSPTEEVYVALLPTSAQRTFRFTVTNATGTYSGEASAKLTEGKYVEATGLKLTKQNQ